MSFCLLKQRTSTLIQLDSAFRELVKNEDKKLKQKAP